MKKNSNLGKHLLKFVFPIFFVLVCSNVWAWKKEYKEAKKFMKVGAYEQAVEQLEEGLTHSKLKAKKRAKMEEMLVEAKVNASKALFHRGNKAAKKNEVTKALEFYSKAAEYDPSNEQFAKRLAEEKAKLGDIEGKVQAAYDRGVVDNEWEEGLKELEAYRIYESSFPEIAKRIESFQKEASKFYLSKTDNHLMNQKYSRAYKYIEKALKYSDKDNVKKMKNALHHLVMSEEAWENKRYLKAYEEIMKGLDFKPDHPELLAFQERLVEEWCGILYNRGVQAQNDGRLAEAKRKFTELSKYKPGFMNTEELLLEVTSTLASESYDKAEEIMNSESRDNIGTAVAYYLLVQEEHSNLYPDIGDKVDEAKRLLKKELEYRVALDFKNSSAEPGAGGLVKEQILNRVKKSKALKNITILDRDSIDDILREQGLGQGFLDETTAIEVKKIKGIQVGIRGEVIKVSVKESGRDRPSYGSSRYVSGTRYVPNPAYQQAQAEVQAAQSRVLQAQSSVNQAQQQNNQMMQQNSSAGGQFGALMSGLSQLSSSISMAGVNKAKSNLANAQSRLAGTPMQIEENIESDYRYEIFDLKVQGEVVIALKVINYTTSEISDVHTIRKRDEAKDRYIPGDPGKNVKSDPIQLPTIEEFKSQLMLKAVDETFASLLKELSGVSYSHYTAGKKSEDMGLENDAVESYMRFIYSAPSLKDKRVQYANDYIYDHIGLRVLRKRK